MMLKFYKHCLEEHPLVTKMVTGGILSLSGDAIAQIRSRPKAAYNKRRAVSFMMFDMSYRAIQHTVFPIIISLCQGDLLTALIVGSIAYELNTTTTNILAAVEQTLANQLVIVPFLYYPIFFMVTGLVQGMTYTQVIEKAKRQFPVLIKRSFIFWLPCHFIQFMFIEEDMQVPFISLVGLCWTIILSSIAGGCVTKHNKASAGLPISSSTNGPLVFHLQHCDFDAVEDNTRQQQPFCASFSIRKTLITLVVLSVGLSLIRQSILTNQFLDVPSIRD